MTPFRTRLWVKNTGVTPDITSGSMVFFKYRFGAIMRGVIIKPDHRWGARFSDGELVIRSWRLAE